MAGYRGFGGGFGGNQMQNIMKQAQKMQADMQKAQEELDAMEIEGSSGGGLVKVVMNGKKIVKGITINENAVDLDDLTMLEDLIIAALNEGYDKADEAYEEKMGAFGAMGGLGL